MPEIGMRIGALTQRTGRQSAHLVETSYEVSGWISVVSTTTHRALPPGNVVGLLQQILAAMGSTGVFFLTTSFLHPTLITMLIILFDISSYCACMLPAVSQSILSHVPDLWRTSKKWLLDERRVRASMADRRRQVMGPNAKVV